MAHPFFASRYATSLCLSRGLTWKLIISTPSSWLIQICQLEQPHSGKAILSVYVLCSSQFGVIAKVSFVFYELLNFSACISKLQYASNDVLLSDLISFEISYCLSNIFSVKRRKSCIGWWWTSQGLVLVEGNSRLTSDLVPRQVRVQCA